MTATSWRGRCVAAAVGLLVAQGCVIRYGEQPESLAAPPEAQGPRPVDFAPYERKLAQLVDEAEVVDSRDRLELAWQLAEQFREADPAAQHVVADYLDRMMEIEVRANPVSAPMQTRVLSTGFGGAAAVDSTELAGPEPLPEPPDEPVVDLLDPMEMEAEPDGEGEVVAVDEGPDVDALLAESARMLESDKTAEAMSVLEACRGLVCWDGVEAAWNDARDRQVFIEKEALAVRLLELRGEPEVEVQRAGLLEIQGALSTLRATWPGTIHQDDLDEHIRRVQKELELLPEEGE